MRAGPAGAARFGAAGQDWLLPDWPAPPAIDAFATTRHRGASRAPRDSLNLAAHCGDDPAAVTRNRRAVGAFLPTPPVWLEQVHGRSVVRLDARNVAAARARPPVADAAVTDVPGVVCAVLTADCLPVLFADRAGGAVGAAHAGWRGLAAGVLETTVAALGGLGVPAARVVAAFCDGDPAAGDAFAPRPGGKWHADLYRLARRRLAAAGIVDVTGGGHCTFTEHARFFSYRRERDTGRQAAFVWRTIRDTGV
jgi:copper oxidase (laccase) domain-containing protein